MIPGTSQSFHDEFPNSADSVLSGVHQERRARGWGLQESGYPGSGDPSRDLANLVLKHHLDSGILLEGEFFHVSPTEAEIVKYAKNSFYAMKVIFGNHFQRLANNLEQDWGVVKRIITHPQERGIVDSHLDEIGGKDGFRVGCLPKDTIAIRAKFEDLGLEADMFESILSDNETLSRRSVAVFLFLERTLDWDIYVIRLLI